MQSPTLSPGTFVSVRVPCMSDDSVISREAFVVNMHILEKVSKVPFARIINLAGFESKVSHCIAHSILSRS